jgi:hypothetical protein
VRSGIKGCGEQPRDLVGNASARAARVFSMDIEQAALAEWDLKRGQMSLRRWSPEEGVTEVTRSYP